MAGSARTKRGYSKIEMACKLAKVEGIAYVWVDTCCIDKSSSVELSEAINSMFQWYKDSLICYAYLSDLRPFTDLSRTLKSCRWFTRGWTLQELIAPTNINFFDQNWGFIGNKKDLMEEVSSITGIGVLVLNHTTPLSSVTVATRMSWASYRQTTREEDMAYCLLGIFSVNMPLIYGEGSKAFTRLQEEIIRSICDLSIFAWKAVPDQDERHSRRYSGALAKSPKLFSSCRHIIRSKETRFHADFSVTNRGIRMPAGLIGLSIKNSQGCHYVLCLDCSTEGQSNSSLAIYLRKCGADLFIRDHPSSLATVTPESGNRYRFRTIYILSKLPESPCPLQDGFPSPDDDLVISRRVSAIRICLPPGLVVYNANPPSHRDSQDEVFFSTESTHDGWCAITIEGTLRLDGQHVPVSCFFACFGWNCRQKYLVSTLVNLSTCDPISINRLVSELEREQNDFIPWALEDLEYFGIPLQGFVTLEAAGHTFKLSHIAKKVFVPTICKSEMYQVEIFLD